MDFLKIRDIIRTAAENADIKEYEIYCSIEDNISAETLKNEISSFSSGVGGGVGFRCIVDGKMGYASTNILDSDELCELVLRAQSNARIIENDDEVFIFKGSEFYESINAPTPVVADAEKLKSCALKVQADAYGYDSCVVDGTQSGALSFACESYLYNSYGLELTNKVGMTGCFCVSVINSNGEAQNNVEFALGLEGDEVDTVASKSVDGAKDKLGATSVESGKYDIVIDGSEMMNLLEAYSTVFSAKSARMGISLLAGKEGEVIASECVNITDDPMREGCPIQTAFDGEGVATHKKHIVENGVLKTLLYDLTNAKIMGKESTGNGQRGSYASQVAIRPYNFSIEAGDKALDELFEIMGEGIYITSLVGLFVAADATTGDFSIESSGFRIRNGKKAEAIKGFTIAGNFFELLKNIQYVSDKVKWGIPMGFCVFGSPAVYVKNISVAGQ